MQRWRKLVLLLLVLSVGAAMRLAYLESVPPQLHLDETGAGLSAVRILRERTAIYRPGMSGISMLAYYSKAASIAIWGQNEVGVRFDGSIAGILCIAFLFLAVNEMWGLRIATFSAFFLAASHFHTHISRSGLAVIQGMMLYTFGLWMLARIYARKRGELGYICLGVAIGASIYLYAGARLLILVAVPLVILHNGSWRSKALVLLVAFAVMAPLLRHSPNTILARSQSVILLNEQALRHALNDPAATVQQDFWKAISMNTQRYAKFYLGKMGDGSSFYPIELPTFDPVTMVAYLLGIILALMYVITGPYKRLAIVILFYLFSVALITGGILTIDAPNAGRVLPASMILCVFAAIGTETVVSQLVASRWLRQLAWITILAIVLYLNVNLYFNQAYELLQRDSALPMAYVLRSTNEGCNLYVSSHSRTYANHNTLTFIVQRPILTVGESEPIDEPFAVVSDGARDPLFEHLQTRFPDGEFLRASNFGAYVTCRRAR